MQSTPSLPLLPGPIRQDGVLYPGQVELLDLLTVYLWWTELIEVELFLHLTVCKQKKKNKKQKTTKKTVYLR